jgi:serine/threonine protein kinase/tetratricopeptide (TPR) repeat protein
MAPAAELTTGSTFAGRYQIIEELSQGGMGRVYKVFDTDIKEKIALKLLRPEIAFDKDMLERFSNELKLARKISHRNVCRMFDLGKWEGTSYITMEFVTGEDLKRFIRKSGRIGAGKAVAIAKHICDGLAEAHRLGVIHRDLKPQNIMVDEEGNARIMDFGIARALKGRGMTGAGVMIGTPEYMSPEQVEGKEVDQRSDIYSLGVILYEMVTGQTPFEGDTPLSIAVKHKTEPPPDPGKINPQISGELSRLILRCLEKDRDRRFPSAEELGNELTRIEKTLPGTAPLPTKRKSMTSREITVTLGVRKILIPAVVLAVLILAGLAAWRLILRAKPQEHSIAVIHFQNQTGDSVFDYLQEALPNLLISSLEQSPYVQVTTWERLYDLLSQSGKAQIKFIDRDTGFELCLRDGIEAIVLGTYTKAGDVFATEIKILDVRTKKLLKSATAQGEGVGSILAKQIDVLSKEISRGIGLPKKTAEGSIPRIADITTASMEAYQLYLKGLEALNRFYFEDARRDLEKATAIDPQFASAYLVLASVYNYTNESALRIEAIKKAKMHSGKATDKERLFIESLYTRVMEKDPQKQLSLDLQLVQKYPKEKTAYMNLAATYRGSGMNVEALEAGIKCLDLDPTFGPALNTVAYAYLDSGDFIRAEEYFKRYASFHPADANPLDSLADLYFRMGRFDEAIGSLKAALKIKPDWGSEEFISLIMAMRGEYPQALEWMDQFIRAMTVKGWQAQGYWWEAFFEHLLGRRKSSDQDLNRAADIWKSIGYRDGPWLVELARGFASLDKGDSERAKRSSDELISLTQVLRPILIPPISLYSACIEIQRGDWSAARQKIEDVGRYLEKTAQNRRAAGQLPLLYALVRGEWMLAQGRADEAIAFLEKEWVPQGPPSAFITFPLSLFLHNLPMEQDVLARAYQKAGNPDRAIAEYEKLLTFDPGSKWRRFPNPIYHFRLARLLEDKGDKARARDRYQKFLELWAQADPGIPEFEEAKKRLAGLNASLGSPQITTK